MKMKTVALIFNLVLFGFTCLVMVTDGPPTETAYIVFTLWTLLTLVISPLVIYRSFNRPVTRIVGMIFNVVLLGFLCWALADQYPHPNEEGFIPFVALMFLTPVLNLVMLFLGLKAGRAAVAGNANIHFGLTL